MSTRRASKRNSAAAAAGESQGAPVASVTEDVERKAPTAKSRPKTSRADTIAMWARTENAALLELSEAIKGYFVTRELHSLRDWRAKHRDILPRLTGGLDVFYTCYAAQYMEIDIRLPFLIEVYFRLRNRYVSKEEVEEYGLKELPGLIELWETAERKRQAVRDAIDGDRAVMAAATVKDA